MKRIMCLILLAGIIPVTLVSGDTQKEDEGAIKKVMEQMETAYNERDWKTIHYHMDEDYHNWLGTHQGRDINVELTGKMVERQNKMMCKRTGTVGIVFVNPGVALFKAHYEFSGMVDKYGKALPVSRFLGAYVLAKKDGRWRVVTFFSRREK